MKSKILSFLFLLISICSWTQEKNVRVHPSVKNFQKNYQYQKSENHKGPNKNDYSSPSTLNENSRQSKNYHPSGKNKGTVNYSPQKIKKSRSQNSPKGSGKGNGSGNGGNKERDPEMGKPKPIEFDTPEFDTPKVDLPDIDPPTISEQFWKTLGIILLVIVLLIAIYFIAKNYRPKDKKIIAPISESDWNPDLITKTELELRLEEAMLRGDYRACIRIYFTFILKEMIRLKRIRWKKDLTNFDYLLQVQGNQKIDRNDLHKFAESIRIYDLVWYGEYDIKNEEYLEISPLLENYYKQLNTKND
jgi:hypothetical protein